MKNSWQTKKLGEVCDFQNGFAFKSTEYEASGFFVMRIGNVQDGYITLADPKYIKKSYKPFDRFILNSGDILISLTGNVGRVGILQDAHLPAVLNQRVARITLKSDTVMQKAFLFYFLKSSYFIEELISAGHGAAQQNISTKDIIDLEIPTPPLPEQQRIVKILDEVFAAAAKAKENAEKNLANAGELFQSYLHSVFTNPGKGWEEKTIGEVCNEIFAGGDAPKNYTDEKTEKNQIPIYANAIKNRGLYGYTNVARVTKPSISIAARGSGTGHTELRDESYFPIVRLIVLIANEELVTMEFLKYKIDTLDIIRSGSAIPQLTVPMIREYKIPLPKLKEQQSIVAKLDALSTETKKLGVIYKQKLLALEELKKSVLAKAFRGEL
ncbi:MAG: restriction endonuclease subunit S [bacterium]